MSNLLPGERIDELQRNGYRIIQNPEKFCFGMDAVLLSGFARAKKHENCLDLGCHGGASARPQRRAFAESGVANAVCRYDPSRENAFGALRRARQTRNLKYSFR